MAAEVKLFDFFWKIYSKGLHGDALRCPRLTSTLNSALFGCSSQRLVPGKTHQTNTSTTCSVEAELYKCQATCSLLACGWHLGNASYTHPPKNIVRNFYCRLEKERRTRADVCRKLSLCVSTRPTTATTLADVFWWWPCSFLDHVNRAWMIIYMSRAQDSVKSSIRQT